jgi:hypothetical protein
MLNCFYGPGLWIPMAGAVNQFLKQHPRNSGSSEFPLFEGKKVDLNT